MRRIIKSLLLVFLGLLIGFIAYEAIMFIRVSRLRSENPVTTSLIEAREAEAKARGEQPKRLQVWVPLDRISPNLQRAVLAGEDTNFATHNGFDYQAIQKHGTTRYATRPAKPRRKVKTTTGCQTFPTSNVAHPQSLSSWQRTSISPRADLSFAKDRKRF